MANKIKIMIVDDHGLVLAGIKRMLADEHDFEIVAEAASAEEAIQLLQGSKALAESALPHVVLMDLKMPTMDGLAATKRILQKNPMIRVLILTASKDSVYPLRLLEAGAKGYLTKGVQAEEMVKAIRRVHEGGHYIAPELAHKLAIKKLSPEARTPFDKLSERELQVAIMVAEGQSIAVIAKKLFLSVKTVNSYRYRIFEKLNVKNDVEMTLLAVRYGLIDANEQDFQGDR